MMVRDYRPEDKSHLEAIHAAQGIDYRFPDLDHPLFFVRKVICNGDKILGSLVLKICAEAYLLLDGQQEPQEKLTEMQLLQSSVLNEAYAKGLDEIHAAIPEIGFDKRLRQLGWNPDRDGWHLWTRSTLDEISGRPGV
jgi:hypothetical protein